MRGFLVLLLSTCALFPALAQTGPTDAKARATFVEAQGLRQSRHYFFAMQGFRKANQQDGGHCQDCLVQAIAASLLIPDYKIATQSAQALLDIATTPAEKSAAYGQLGGALLSKGMESHKEKDYADAERQLKAALELQPDNANILYKDGVALAYLKQDEAAKARFVQSLHLVSQTGVEHQRISRLVERPELARARMAVPFQVTSIDGKTISLDSLAGKVVLIDFWATWCGACKEALPHIQQIAQKFQGESFVVLSVSLDSDKQKWEDFVRKNGMTWLQYRDGGFNGPVSKLYSVTAIPHTFTIDADGVMQDEHIGDASIEGKLRKLISRAHDLQLKVPADVHAQSSPALQSP